MKVNNLLRKIAAPVLALVTGCMPVQTTGYFDAGAGFLKPDSRKATAQVSCEIGADTLFDNDRKLRTGAKYRFLPHPTEKKDGVTAKLDSHLYSFAMSTPLVDKTRFKLHAGAEAGVVDTRGELTTDVDYFGERITLTDKYQETGAFVGINLRAEHHVTKDGVIFVQPEVFDIFERSGSKFGYGMAIGVGLKF